MPRPERKTILISNDDGIDAPGIHALADALAPDYDLLIVAPDRERSATGHAISILREMHLERYYKDDKPWGWSLEGNPADCVKIAIDVLGKERPIDLVVSGINRGQNLGINILYSGTVAAAREGVLQGLPAIAYSVVYKYPEEVRFDTAARVAKELTKKVIERGLPHDALLNVNVPPIAFEDIKGYSITRQGGSSFGDRFQHMHGDPAEKARYRNIGVGFQKSPEEHVDVDDAAILADHVSITPLHTDSTAHHYRDELEDLTIL